MICSLFPVCNLSVPPKWISSKIATINLINLWKGQKAIRKLRELSKEKPSGIKKWLSRQDIWQVHLPPPKHVNRPHYEVMIPNQMHQFDLLYMPSDTLYGNQYKNFLSGIDATLKCNMDCLHQATSLICIK